VAGINLAAVQHTITKAVRAYVGDANPEYVKVAVEMLVTALIVTMLRADTPLERPVMEAIQRASAWLATTNEICTAIGLGGSWLEYAESMQRHLVKRKLLF